MLLKMSNFPVLIKCNLIECLEYRLFYLFIYYINSQMKFWVLFENRPALCNYKEKKKKNDTRMLDTAN